ncbi:unnamed protein product, partial [Didymodactylos carnosus]
TEEDCKTKYKSEYNIPCTAIKKQEYTHFPRIYQLHDIHGKAISNKP